MKRLNSIIAALLCFMLVFNPVIFEAALWAEDNAAAATEAAAKPEEMKESEKSADDATAETDDAYQQLLNTKEGKTKWGMSSGTKKKIREANTNLRDAKGQVGDVKSSLKDTKGELKAIGDTVKGDDNTFDKMTKVAAGIQKALIKTGQLLQKIGQLLKTVGQALQAIGKVLSAIPWTSAIGAALEKVGAVLVKVGTALDYVGKAIEKVGQTAANSDLKFGDLLGTISQAAKDGWKQGEADANAYSQKLDENLKSSDTSESMGGATESNDSSSGDDAPEVEDASQEGVLDN